MTINSLQLNVSTPVAGLGTQTFNVVTAGSYVLAVTYFVPYIAAGTSADSSVTTGGSDLQILLKKNGSTVATLGGSSTPPTQPFISGQIITSCSAGDYLEVVPSSAAAVDNQLNSIKGVVNVYQGGV